ncbi:MAG: DNA-binding beta-propeller fold protein YncE, partial [Planctomycetota bacterium]
MLPRFATSTRRLRIGILLAIPVLASTVVAQIVSDNEVPRDQIQGRWMNFEVAVQNAFEFDPRGLAVYAINQPGSRVVARNSANLELLWEAPMGIGLTSIRLRRGSNELWCVDRVAGAISVIDLRTGKITNTVQTSADPHDLVFDVQQKRAYVTCSASNCVDIVNTNTYKVVKSIDIPAMQPRGITRVGTTVFVTPFMSGNGTAPMGNAQTGDNADVRTIEHVDQIPGVNALPDSDLFAINITASPATDALDHSRTVSGLGTMLYNIHHRPGTNELWIPHTEALNADFVGERNFIAGQVVRNRIAVVKANNGSLVNMIDLDALAPAIDQRCSTPTHVSFSPDGTRAFVTGYGSDSMAVLDLNGPHVSWAGTIDIQRQNLYPDGAGPRASRINFTGEQMWIYNKGENSYARVFLADLPGTPNFEYLSPKARSNGWDPTPADINQGRIHFIRTDNSLSQTSSCDSCHSDGGSDGLAWDLSAYLDPEGTPADQLAFPMDLKGPMVSQPLRHLREVGPFHWRGDNKSLQDFDNIFVTLLERHENGQSGTLTVDFRYLSQFLEHLAVPANPMQAMDRVYTSDQLLGADLFMNLAVRDNLRCVDCHSLPLGTSGEIVDHLDGGLSPTTVIPPLRGIFSKLAKPFHIGGDFGMRTELGGGLTHNGAGSSVAGHLMQSLASGARRFNLTDNQALTIEDFLRSLDTGLAPATAFQVTATPDNFMQVRQNELMYLVNQANLGNCDIVYRYGPVNYNGSSRYMTGTYNPASGGFMQGSAVLPELTLSDLIRLPENGMP